MTESSRWHCWLSLQPTSRLSRLARNHEDWAKRKSPVRTAILVPNILFTVDCPAGMAAGLASAKPRQHCPRAVRALQLCRLHGRPVSTGNMLRIRGVCQRTPECLPRTWQGSSRAEEAALPACRMPTACFQLGLEPSLAASPLLVSHSSRTSSWTRLAVWIISVISARRLCFGTISLQAHSRKLTTV